MDFEVIEKYWWIIVGVLIFYYNNGKPYTFENSAYLWTGAFLMVIFTGRMLMEEGKYQSNQFCTTDTHICISSDQPILAGDYCIFYDVIDSDKLFLKIPIKSITFVVHKDSIAVKGKTIYSFAKVHKVSHLFEIPTKARMVMESHNLNIKNVWLGIYTNYQMPDVKIDEKIISGSETTINTLQQLLAGKMKPVEDIVDSANKITKMRSRKWYEKLFNPPENEED